MLARLLLARDVPDRALALLDRLHDAAVAEGRFGSAIEIRALRALALDAASRSEGALNGLMDALALAQPEGYVRVFADEGPRMAALLRRLVASAERGLGPTLGDVQLEYAVRLLGAAPREPADPAMSAIRIAGGAVLVEPLTDRGSDAPSLGVPPRYPPLGDGSPAVRSASRRWTRPEPSATADPSLTS